MKHLISLALKYIRRQKLRTTLTFLCVTLSVYIFCSFGAYAGSLMQTLLNSEIRQWGSWEADISDWVTNSPLGMEAYETVKKHSAVSDCEIYVSECGYSNLTRDKTDEHLRYIRLSDGKNTKTVAYISCEWGYGNPELIGQHVVTVSMNDDFDKSGVVLPDWIRDWGYEVGDTITFSLDVVTADYDEDSEIIKSVRRELLEETGCSVVRDDPEFNSLSDEDKKKAIESSSMDIQLRRRLNLALDDIPLTNEEHGESCEYTVKIGGFDRCLNEENFYIYRYDQSGFMMEDFLLANPAVDSGCTSRVCIRINENIEYEDGLQMIYNSLGYSGQYYLSDIELLENDFLLALELRSANAITQLLPFIGVFAFFCILLWAVARFVIDNAFEISAKERSSQYAALRIMGASKRQIAAVVFNEAVFYVLTAVPIGTALAYLTCGASVKAIHSVGFEDFEFKANPIFVIGGIALCITAIFISAFTSSMWAARKLSPAEALNFGKPKSKNPKKTRRGKSKLTLSSKKFIKRYTWKNIMRTKSRFFIATVTMAIGVTIFIFMLMVGVNLAYEWKTFSDGRNTFDFYIDIFDPSTNDIYETFCDNELYSDVRIQGSSHWSLNNDDHLTLSEYIDPLLPDGYDHQYSTCRFTAVDRYYYNEALADITRMNYDEFVKSESVIYGMSVYGNQIQYDQKTNKPIKQFDESYTVLDEPLNINILGNDRKSLKITAAICSDEEYLKGMIFPLDSEYFEDYISLAEVYLTVNGRESYEAAEKLASDFSEKYSGDFENNYMFGTGLQEFVKAVVKMALGFVMSVWLVGILSMINSINTSVLNRSRELMMLRSVGMSRKQLRNTVVRESLVFSSVSSIIGTILAILSYALVVQELEIGSGAVFVIAAGMAVSLVVNLAIAYLAAIPGIRSLERAESLVKAV